jgi:multidrug efflux pump subunit AcrB
MNSLTNFSLKNAAAIIIMSVILFVFGSYSGMTLKQESMPNISLPIVFITTSYPAPPIDVMEDVTKRIEKRIVGIEGMKKISSTSNDNFSMITVELVNGRSPDDAKDEIESILQDVQLPAKASKPRVSKFGSTDFPIIFGAVSSKNGMSQAELNRIYKDVMEPTLSSMDGIDHVDSIGQEEATLKLKLNVEAIQQFGLTPTQVSQSIQAAVSSSPAGTADFNGTTQMVRVESDLNTIYSLENMRVTTPTGGTVLLKDISRVEAISESQFISRLNGNPAISLVLYKGKDANTVEFSGDVKKLMDGWEKEFQNIEFTSVYDAADDVKKSINGMLKEGSLGALLASIMILLFLRNIRMTFIVLVSIPLSVLMALATMSAIDITLNIMTLGGLTIAIGRVVDDSIVVIENIYSELQKAQDRNESVIKLATARVASAITSSTLTTAGVFLPITFVSGMLGDLFRPFAITLVVALLASLVVALTVIPMLAKLMVMNSNKIKHRDGENLGKFAVRYRRIIEWSLDNPKKIVFTSMLIFVVSIAGTVPFLPAAFMPDSASNKQIQFSMQLPKETSLEAMDQKVAEIEQMLTEAKDVAGLPAFDFLQSMVGFDMNSPSGERVNYHAVIMATASQASDAKQAAKEYKEKILAMVPQGSEVEGMLMADSMTGASSADFAYVLKGEDLDQLMIAAERVKAKMHEIPELQEIEDNLSERKQQVSIKVDQEKARLYGLSSGQITQAVSSWLGKTEVGEMKFDNVTFKTQVMVDERYKDTVDKIGQFKLATPLGSMVEVRDIAKVQQVDAPASISREMQEQFVKVTAKIDSKDKAGVTRKVTETLNAVELPNGVRSVVQGVNEDIQESFGQMAIAMLAAVMIVYLIMVITFGNASAPFVILFSLPLAAIGGFLGLFVTGESINITSLIGFLMLIGVVVTNAIVLVDRVQQLREDGQSVRDALVEASMNRLRPIIMTAGATVFTLLPLAIGLSEGTLISRGLAVVVIGGLTTSTVLTLVVVPVVYELIDASNRRIARFFGRFGIGGGGQASKAEQSIGM